MVQQPSEREMQLAQQQIDELKQEFRRRRTINLTLFVAFLTLAVLFVFPSGLPMMAFCSLLVSVIFLILCFDANGQLQDVGIRSTKTLYPRLSLLDGKSVKATSDHVVQK
jgi:phosphoglycerol transferase MdoB-like AlkP superfamily enzyme